MAYTEDDINDRKKMRTAWFWIEDTWRDPTWATKWSDEYEMEELYLQLCEDSQPTILLSTTHSNCVTKIYNRLVETEWIEE